MFRLVFPSGVDSRSDLIDFLCCESIGYRVGRRYFSGNVLWVLWEAKPGRVLDPWISCYLMRSRRGEWGYKAMSEDCGPLYFTCPPAFLKVAPVVDPEWREGVREYWEARKARRAARRQAVTG